MKKKQDNMKKSVFRKFVGYYRPYRGLFWVDMLCALTVSVIDLAFPQVLNYFTRTEFADSAQIFRAVAIAGGALLAAYLIRLGCQYFITSWGHIMGARMERDMRQELFDHYQKLSFSYYDRNNTGEMMSKIIIGSVRYLRACASRSGERSSFPRHQDRRLVCAAHADQYSR